MISAERKAELQKLGYTVEDIQKVWGDGWWNGQFRWINTRDDDFGDALSSEDLAWAAADLFEANYAH